MEAKRIVRGKAAIALGCAALAAGIGTERESAAKAGFDSELLLQMRSATVQDEVHPFEPIRLEVRVRGTEGLECHQLSDLLSGGGYLRACLVLERGGEDTARVSRPLFYDGGKCGRGDSEGWLAVPLSVDWLVFVKKRGDEWCASVTPEPGQYQVRFEVEKQDDLFVSVPVQISVTPWPQKEAAAFERLSETKTPWLLWAPDATSVVLSRLTPKELASWEESIELIVADSVSADLRRWALIAHAELAYRKAAPYLYSMDRANTNDGLEALKRMTESRKLLEAEWPVIRAEEKALLAQETNQRVVLMRHSEQLIVGLRARSRGPR